jgi:hypothetical protein
MMRAPGFDSLLAWRLRRHRLARALRMLALYCLVFAALLTATLEIGLRGTDLPWRLIAPTLFYNPMTPPVHRVSADPKLLYELRPLGSVAGKDCYGPFYATVDRYGARGPEHPEPKAPGVFRVLVFGSSPIYGYGVDDEETIPYVMEQVLNADAGEATRFEVWNFGTAAYNYYQNSHLARKMLGRHSPDLVLVQLYNLGLRRAFPPLGSQIEASDLPRLFAGDPSLWLENFPPPCLVPRSWWGALLGRSLTVRSIVAVLARLRPTGPSGHPEFLAVDFDSMCGEARALEAEAVLRGVPVEHFILPFTPDTDVEWVRSACNWTPAQVNVVYQAGREWDYYKEHPPAEILREHAMRLVELLRESGRLPGPAAHKER